MECNESRLDTFLEGWQQNVRTHMLSNITVKSFNQDKLELGVAGGAEASIHSTRRYISPLPSDHAFIKLDFANTFNTLRRDLLLEKVARNMSAL